MAPSKFVVKCGNYAVLVDLHILPLGSLENSSWFTPEHRKEMISLIRELLETRVRQFQEARHQKVQPKMRKDLITPIFLEGGNVRLAVHFIKRHVNLRCVVRLNYRELRVFPERVVVTVSPPENSALPSGNLNLDVSEQACSKYFSSSGETEVSLPSSATCQTCQHRAPKVPRRPSIQIKPVSNSCSRTLLVVLSSVAEVAVLLWLFCFRRRWTHHRKADARAKIHSTMKMELSRGTRKSGEKPDKLWSKQSEKHKRQQAERTLGMTAAMGVPDSQHCQTSWQQSTVSSQSEVVPSQPSLQTQLKESPLTTQVPPFWQGLGRQLLFLAAEEPHKRCVILLPLQKIIANAAKLHKPIKKEDTVKGVVVGESMGLQSSFTQQLNNGMQQADQLSLSSGAVYQKSLTIVKLNNGHFLCHFLSICPDTESAN
ncbi:hypothetical protein DNTS_032864 [Danionella cerebrum]|uniref:Protein SLX4IP n=1 Tax=Danionella cerebrum TaxID=2873325 RepID=A0A553QTS5_9TELE|nr:hypothetical protein DNTS_032864 [Danionella translucida]